jgi:hypothetical protein
MWYKNLGGNHTEGESNTKTHGPGAVFESERPLADLFPNKFQEVDAPLKARKSIAAPVPTLAIEAPVVEVPSEPEPVEVTSEYPGAEEAGLRVVQVMDKGKIRYNIYEVDSETPINDTPLTGQKTTKKLVELGVEEAE